MKPIVASVALLSSLAFGAAPPADKPDFPAVTPVQTAFDKLVRAATDADWPSELTARTELASLAQEAVPKLTEAARSHGNARVRRACYELLTSAFAKDERAVDTVVRFGLHDQDFQIRYRCAFLLGDLKVYHAERALRAALKGATGKDNEFLRYVLAKSLAQFGNADVLRTLFAAVSDDSFMVRHVGNIGLKGLSGKNVEDFQGYHYAEGAFVIAGNELATAFDAITAAERKAERFQAVTAYFKWLKTERPELYKYATYRRREKPLSGECSWGRDDARWWDWWTNTRLYQGRLRGPWNSGVWRRAPPVRVDGYGRTWHVDDAEDLEAVLALRDARGGGVFWLTHDEQYPSLAIRVSGDLADVHFFPRDGHPGFRCLGGEGMPDGGSMRCEFQGCDPAYGEDTPNEFVVPLRTATSIASEFL